MKFGPLSRLPVRISPITGHQPAGQGQSSGGKSTHQGSRVTFFWGGAFKSMGCPRGTQSCHVVADQLQAVDRERLIKRLGILPDATLVEVLGVLQAMFAV